MATPVALIVNDAAKILQDDTNVAWGRDELLRWVNAGQREIVLGKPDAYVFNTTVQLTPGTRQEIPPGGNVFMKLTRNMTGTNGATAGRAVLPIPMQVLDEQKPNWHVDPPQLESKHYAFDERDQKHFYVYPAQPNPAGYAEIVYSATPLDAADNGNLAISDLYQSAILDYVLYRAYSKDSEYTRNDAKAASYYQTFVGLLVGKSNGESKNDARNSAIGNQRAGKKAA